MSVGRDFGYYRGYEDENGKPVRGYEDLVAELLERFPLGTPILGEENEKDFIALFGSILRLRNILTAFDDFAGKEILSDRDRQDYQSRYIDLYDKYKRERGEKEDVVDDLVFELELVRQDEINIDYILRLIEKYQESLCTDKEILVSISKAINASPELRSKKELIESFIDRVNPEGSILDDWSSHVRQEMERELSDIIESEKLKPVEARKFVENALRDGVLRTTGTGVNAILPPASIFDKSRETKRLRVIELLKKFFQRFFGLV